MFFTAILTLGFVAQMTTQESKPGPENTKYFKNLSPITYNINMSHQNKIMYNKVPTKLIKINKKSN